MSASLNLTVLGLAFLAGAALPVQAGANAELARILGHPLSAALVSALVGLAFMLLVMVAFRAPVPSLPGLRTAPLWSWLGGIMGTGFLVLAILAAPKLGAATFVALAVAGQMCLSVLIDHFALIGFESRPATLARLAGILLIVAGVVLVQFSGREQDRHRVGDRSSAAAHVDHSS
ncbi:DMT family transporter [Rhodoligotrophos ferricapiens]|uniref:DMT family transporter n=1 Tax=Rhodoligotrophos ferricapiens TaxID=3069264 RepID=UPI00315DC4A1